jgi:hypothetical protein
MDVVTQSDWVIDVGPVAGDEGGKVVACGPPLEVADNAPKPDGNLSLPGNQTDRLTMAKLPHGRLCGSATELFDRMYRLGMLLMQKGCEPFSKAVVASSRLVKQKLLRFAREICPPSHDGETERVFEVFFVVGIHFSAVHELEAEGHDIPVRPRLSRTSDSAPNTQSRAPQLAKLRSSKARTAPLATWIDDG